MEIKAVEMTRKIRDASYKRTKALSKEDKLRLIHEEATLFLKKFSGQDKKSVSKTPIASRNK
jgi:hypothetical protein